MNRKFKVGDRARIISEDRHVFFSIGDEVEVVSVNYSQDTDYPYVCKGCKDNKTQQVTERQLAPIDEVVFNRAATRIDGPAWFCAPKIGFSETPVLSRETISHICSGLFAQQPSVSNVPLIKPNKLLINIKLD